MNRLSTVILGALLVGSLTIGAAGCKNRDDSSGSGTTGGSSSSDRGTNPQGPGGGTSPGQGSAPGK
jgi:hypothetical protein